MLGLSDGDFVTGASEGYLDRIGACDTGVELGEGFRQPAVARLKHCSPAPHSEAASPNGQRLPQDNDAV